MSQSARRPLASVLPIAEPLLALLRPACSRVEIAGSIRRRCAEVGDVELVAVPRETEAISAAGQAGLFGPTMEKQSAVWSVLDGLRRESRVEPFVVADGARVPLDDRRWREKRLPGAARMLRLWLPKPELCVDLFLTTPESWGPVLAIRTGSAEYSAAVVARAKRGGRVRVHDARVRPVISGYQPSTEDEGAVRLDDGTWLGSPLSTPEERDYFAAVGVRWRESEERETAGDVQAV